MCIRDRMCIVVVGAAGLYWYVSHMLNGGEGGQIQNAQGLDEVVPPELTKDQMNILILGLDYAESGDAERSKDFPMTDMIQMCIRDRAEILPGGKGVLLVPDILPFLFNGFEIVLFHLLQLHNFFKICARLRAGRSPASRPRRRPTDAPGRKNPGRRA